MAGIVEGGGQLMAEDHSSTATIYSRELHSLATSTTAAYRVTSTIPGSVVVQTRNGKGAWVDATRAMDYDAGQELTVEFSRRIRNSRVAVTPGYAAAGHTGVAAET